MDTSSQPDSLSNAERDHIALCWLLDALNGLRAAVFHPEHRNDRTHDDVKRALAEATAQLEAHVTERTK